MTRNGLALVIAALLVGVPEGEGLEDVETGGRRRRRVEEGVLGVARRGSLGHLTSLNSRLA